MPRRRCCAVRTIWNHCTAGNRTAFKECKCQVHLHRYGTSCCAPRQCRCWHLARFRTALRSFQDGKMATDGHQVRHSGGRTGVAQRRARAGRSSGGADRLNEHFCEWCLWGEPRTYQIEALPARPARTLQATIRFIAQPVSSREQSVYISFLGATAFNEHANGFS